MAAAATSPQGFFITGTDTNCGKTLITLGLMHRLKQQGLRVLGMKPVAAGAEQSPEGLRNADALGIQQEASLGVAYELVNPYCYSQPIAPHLAAQGQGESIEIEKILGSYSELATLADMVVVEGAGGWRVPLTDLGLALSDLAVQLQLPVVLVVGMRLGCLNHAILSAESIERSGLALVGWVANRVDPDMAEYEGNLRTLKQWLNAPCLGEVPFLSDAAPQKVSEFLSLP